MLHNENCIFYDVIFMELEDMNSTYYVVLMEYRAFGCFFGFVLELYLLFGLILYPKLLMTSNLFLPTDEDRHLPYFI